MTEEEKMHLYKELIFVLYMSNLEAIKTLNYARHKILELDENLYNEIFHSEGVMRINGVPIDEMF